MTWVQLRMLRSVRVLHPLSPLSTPPLPGTSMQTFQVPRDKRRLRPGTASRRSLGSGIFSLRDSERSEDSSVLLVSNPGTRLGLQPQGRAEDRGMRVEEARMRRRDPGRCLAHSRTWRAEGPQGQRHQRVSRGTAASQTGVSTPQNPDNTEQELLNAYDLAIPYLQSPSLVDTPEGQAVFASSANQINAQYAQAKQSIMQQAAANGLDPSNGVVQQQLTDLAAQQQSDLSNVQSSFTQQYTNNLETSVSMLTNLVNLDNSQNAEAIGLQMAQDQEQQSNAMDLLNALGYGSGGAVQASDISSGILSCRESIGSQVHLAGQAGSGLSSVAQGIATSPNTSSESGTNPFSNNTNTSADTALSNPNLLSLLAGVA